MNACYLNFSYDEERPWPYKERKDTGMSFYILLCRCTRLVNVGLIDIKSKLAGILAVKFTSYRLVSVVNAGGSTFAGSSSFVGHN
jgi:hypothetical protein